MDRIKFQSGWEFNWKHSLTESQVSEAVKEYKAKHKAEFESKMFAELSNKSLNDIDNLVGKQQIEAGQLAEKMYADLRQHDAVMPEWYPYTAGMGVKSATTCAHTWKTHTQAQFIVPTGEANNLSGAEVNRIEMRVTKVYCTHCLEVKEI